MIKQLLPVPVPDDFCYWSHPDLKLIDPREKDQSECGYSEEEWRQMQVDGGIEIFTETHYYDEIPQIPTNKYDDWSQWKPESPTPIHFLISAFDSEDGIILWWAKEAKADAEG